MFLATSLCVWDEACKNANSYEWVGQPALHRGMTCPRKFYALITLADTYHHGLVGRSMAYPAMQHQFTRISLHAPGILVVSSPEQKCQIDFTERNLI